VADPANILSVREAARRIQAGNLTSEALVGTCLERIAAREGTIGAWSHIDPDTALAQARHRDSTPSKGALHGIPVAIKDVIDTADMPTGYGSPIYEGHRPRIDAECVALLRRAGAVVLGKTVSTEFAAITPGKTANPHNPAHTPGGSSSGSAAAVADRMAPLALGTQTVGSTIRPAAYCGIVGYKPSYGTFGLRGVLPQAPSLDTLGLFARGIDDINLLADALMAADGAFATEAPSSPPRVGICPSPHWPDAHPETVAAMVDAEDRLAAAGAKIARIDLPPHFADVLDAQWTILKFEIARTLTPERENQADGLSAGLTAIIDDGLALPVTDYRAALELAHRCRAEMEPVFEAFDVLLTPSAASEAPEGLTATTDLLFQRLWTILHLPCLTLPGFTGPSGLPVGVQLVGRFGRDAELLSAAAWCERVLIPNGPKMPG
jgi:Asp-tRNA(Asn)/Glu-tRNA(Gln) amidotransferase A subunit family amidase